jgi:hypothetical protein
VTRYATLISSIVAAATRLGRGPQALVCEVLSTQPFELGAVLQRFGLGRFRVTQKANLDDVRDVYRSENAAAADWIMLGNHDTPPLWRLLASWEEQGRLTARAAYLASRLRPENARRQALVSETRATHHDRIQLSDLGMHSQLVHRVSPGATSLRNHRIRTGLSAQSRAAMPHTGRARGSRRQ